MKTLPVLLVFVCTWRCHSLSPQNYDETRCQPNAEEKEWNRNLHFQGDREDQCHLFHPTNEIKSIFYIAR